MNFTPTQLDTMYYACADAEKFWRHKRREVQRGECEWYTEEDCTQQMKRYREMWEILAGWV